MFFCQPLSEESSFVGSVKKGRHHRSHRCTLLSEAMPIGVPSAAYRRDRCFPCASRAFCNPQSVGAEKSGAAPKNPFLCKVLPSRQFQSATPKPSAFIKTFFEKKASKSLPGRKKVIPLQPQTRSNGVIRPALRSEEEVIEKFTYQAASVRIQRKTNRQGLEEKTEE